MDAGPLTYSSNESLWSTLKLNALLSEVLAGLHEPPLTLPPS